MIGKAKGVKAGRSIEAVTAGFSCLISLLLTDDRRRSA
jgi:hypothetical protein